MSFPLSSLIIWLVAAVATGGVIFRPWRVPEYVWALGAAVLLAACGLLPLGTALGDWTADTAGLGYTGAAAVFGGLLALVVAAYYWTSVS
ncbi:MAG: hypothetical protein RR704_12265, partial [Stenotrophomonas sp.]